MEDISAISHRISNEQGGTSEIEAAKQPEVRESQLRKECQSGIEHLEDQIVSF